jgi:hypothetical protein
VDGTNANGINEEEAAPTTISEPKKIDFAESPRFSRKVVSYKLKGEECVEDIDRVELTWRHETESWLPPLSEWWEYDESNLSEFEKNYTETYNSILTNPGEAYTLEMVIYLKDGKSATLTFKGGYYRDFGNDGYMRWNWIDGTLVSVSSVWSFNGSIIWLTRRDNYLYMADYCEINSYSITFTAEEITYKPAGESNIMRFCIGQTEEAQIEIVLDGSFFPD